MAMSGASAILQAMLLARVRRTLRERALLAKGARVLVACSGGPDSAALLDVLARLREELELDLHAASVDHGLRPGSERDVEVARELARRLAVPFTALTLELAAGGSTQARARAARYETLFESARGLSADALAVGHTLDDQAETVLSRLLRGAGVRGLAGIAPRRPDGVIRPLIDARREEVRAHVTRFALPFVLDPSNADPRFERARLRAGVLPALAVEDASVIPHLASLADEAREIMDWIAVETRTRIDVESPPDRLEVPDGPPPLRRAILSAWVTSLTGRPPKRAHLRELERAGPKAEIRLGEGWTVSREGRFLCAKSDGVYPEVQPFPQAVEDE